MKSLVIAAMVITLVIFVITVPVFFVVRGTEVEIPFALLVLTLGITGILAAQMAFIRKGKEKKSRVLSIAIIVQVILLLIVDVFVFINISPDYYWYPATVLVLILVLMSIVGAKIGLDRKAGGGKLI
jgi:peptidoglycan/LPS O-acetylase OafA/YrhL